MLSGPWLIWLASVFGCGWDHPCVFFFFCLSMSIFFYLFTSRTSNTVSFMSYIHASFSFSFSFSEFWNVIALRIWTWVWFNNSFPYLFIYFFILISTVEKKKWSRKNSICLIENIFTFNAMQPIFCFVSISHVDGSFLPLTAKSCFRFFCLWIAIDLSSIKPLFISHFLW